MDSPIRHIITLAVGALTILGFWSCQQEPLDENRALEDYTHAFISQFGLMDPNQDWSDAVQTSVTIDMGASTAKDIRVLCEIEGQEYLLASASYVGAGRFKISFDMPEAINSLTIVIDGERHYAVPGGIVNTAQSRADSDSDESAETDVNPIKWLLIAEDLGAIGDFDFNDFIAQITVSPTRSLEYDAYYYPYEDVEGGSAVLSRAEGGSAQQMTIKAMAAGGTMKLFLHYRTYNGTDYIIGPGNAQGYILTSDLATEEQADKYEWHQWFSDNAGRTYPPTVMINTGSGTKDLNGCQVTLPFRSNNKAEDGVIDSDYSMENYSIFNKKGEGRFGIGRGFYLTVGTYIADESNSGDIVFGQVIGRTNRGDAPQMLAISDIGSDGGPWQWPIERRNMAAVYPQFKKWATSNTNSLWHTSTPIGSPGVDYYVRKDR